MTDEFARFAWRTGTAAAWTAANPVLLEGEPGYESDTDLLKIGDGVTAWTALDYHGSGGGGAGAFMGAKAYRSTSQGIPNGGVATLVTLPDGEVYDTSSIHDPVTNSGRLTIPAGQTNNIWTFTASVQWSANSTSYRTLQIYRNGAALTRSDGAVKDAAPAAGVCFQSVSVDVQVTAGDYFEIYVSQATTTNPLNLLSATFSGHLLGTP